MFSPISALQKMHCRYGNVANFRSYCSISTNIYFKFVKQYFLKEEMVALRLSHVVSSQQNDKLYNVGKHTNNPHTRTQTCCTLQKPLWNHYFIPILYSHTNFKLQSKYTHTLKFYFSLRCKYRTYNRHLSCRVREAPPVAQTTGNTDLYLSSWGFPRLGTMDTRDKNFWTKQSAQIISSLLPRPHEY